MGCLVIVFALISARLGLVYLWLSGNLLSRAFESSLLPLIGFFLIPWTTLIYALAWDYGSRGVHGFEWFFVILAFMTDIGAFAGGNRKARSR